MARLNLADFARKLTRPLMANKPRGVARVGDRRALNGTFRVLRTGSPWRDLPERHGPYTTVYNRFNRWPGRGLGARFRDPDHEIARQHAVHRLLHHRAHRRAVAKNGGRITLSVVLAGD